MSPQSQPKTHTAPPSQKLLLAAIFGLLFGFLLQKGGVAKFHILIGVLIFQDFTVIKVMLSAILVGMIGVFALRHFHLLQLQTKPTRLGATIIGGLIFGFGFACSGYCPGTGAAALGQANWDALFVITGLIAGSYLYAIASARISRTVNRWGDRGQLLLPDLIHARLAPFVLGFALSLAACLWALDHFTQR
jgi:uncharacterized protein